MDLSNVERFCEILESELTGYSSLKFAFETAQFNMLNSDAFKNIKYVKTSGLIGIMSCESLSAQLGKLREAGFDTFKSNVNPETFDDAVRFIKSPGSEKEQFRLDCNGSFSFKEAKRKFEGIELPNLEYIEQPVADLDELIELQKSIQVEITPDESVQNIATLQNLIAKGTFKFIVVKPMVYSSFRKLKDIIENTISTETKLIISSSFESALGRSALNFLASMCSHNSAHGIISGDWYTNDVELDDANYFVINNLSEMKSVNEG